MDLILKSLAVLLLLGGVPTFLALGAVLGAFASIGPPAGGPDESAMKFFMTYTSFALAGLLSAAGGVLWAATRLAYPTRSFAKG